MAAMDERKAPAARSLRLWMKATSVTQASLAKRLGCSRQAVSQWLTGESRPTTVIQHAIEAMSAGGVRTEDWLLPDEVAKVEGVRS